MESRGELLERIISYLSHFKNKDGSHYFDRCGKIYETTADDRTIEKYARIAVELSLALRKLAYCGSFDGAAFELLDEREMERENHIERFAKEYLGRPEIRRIVCKAANVGEKDEKYIRLLSEVPVMACAYDTASIFLRVRMESPLCHSLFDIGAEPPSKWDCALAMMLSLLAVDAKRAGR